MLVLFFMIFLNLKSQDLLNLKPVGFVNDFENIFTPDQKTYLEQLLSDYEKKTSIEFCLVTLAEYEPNSNYDVNLANKWGVGKEGLDNGLMIILSKTNRKFSIRTGYGLESFLPDGRLKGFTNKIFPNTLSKGDFFTGMKELIIACQNEIGYDGYDFLMKSKKIKDDKSKEALKSGLMIILYIVLIMLILSGIIYLIIMQYKKKEKFLNLKKEIKKILDDIEHIRIQITQLSNQLTLPTEIENVYNSRIKKLTNNLITDEEKQKMQFIYNQLLVHNQIINSTNNSIKYISNSKSDIEQYLQDNYPYCDKYLKLLLTELIPITQIDKFKTGEYNVKRMNSLIGIQTSIDNKLKTFLNKTVKINSIIQDNNNCSKKIEELKTSYVDYNRKKNILAGAKIGKRYNSLVNIDFDSYISKLSLSISNSFNSLKNNELDSAMLYYSDYITTISVLNSAFTNVSLLLADYNRCTKYITDNEHKLNSTVSDIDMKINKSGVSYHRKSTYEDVKSNISKYKGSVSLDVILASEILSSIITNSNDLLRYIKSDISSHESSYSSSTYSSGYSSSSSSSSSSTSFGGGSFGGGGVSGGF